MMDLNERQAYQEEDVDELGSALMTIGFLFLVVDLLVILLFASWSNRDGSYFFVIWAIAQALVGVALIAAGYYKKFKRHMKEDA